MKLTIEELRMIREALNIFMKNDIPISAFISYSLVYQLRKKIKAMIAIAKEEKDG